MPTEPAEDAEDEEVEEEEEEPTAPKDAEPEPEPDDEPELEDDPSWDAPEAAPESSPVVAPAPLPVQAAKPTVQPPQPTPVAAPVTSPANDRMRHSAPGHLPARRVASSVSRPTARATEAARTSASGALPPMDEPPVPTTPSSAPPPASPTVVIVEQQESKRPRAFKFFRLHMHGNVGYTGGSSNYALVYDPATPDVVPDVGSGETSIEQRGSDSFGGATGGFMADLELLELNAWLDFRKNFGRGGTWSALLGYDSDIEVGKRCNLTFGGGVGVMRRFGGHPYADLQVDTETLSANRISGTGVEGRLMGSFDVRIVGPLHTGITGMGGYHYLFNIEDELVESEHGWHYGAVWNVSLRFELMPGRRNGSKK